MTYKIEQIEGIGTKFGQQLMTSGVHTTSDLLEKCGTADKVRQLELATGISSKQLNSWMRQADLMRVSGIGPEFGQLLEEAGIESVMQLASRDPENVTQLVARVNAEKKLTRALPPVSIVSRWVDQAKEMTANSALAMSAGIDKPVMDKKPEANMLDAHKLDARRPEANKPGTNAMVKPAEASKHNGSERPGLSAEAMKASAEHLLAAKHGAGSPLDTSAIALGAKNEQMAGR